MQHHHHHVDEFSVTELRHTLAEAWRVVADRRWWFVFPCLIAATMAFGGSHLVPRRYTGTTLLERTNDPVMAGLLGQRWTQAYEEQRKQIGNDLKKKEAVEAIVDELDLTAAAFDPNAPADAAARSALVWRITNGVSSQLVESTANRDVLEVNLTLGDPTFIPSILRRIRDRYVIESRRAAVRVLRDAEAFFQTQVDKTGLELAELERSVAEMEQRYPGIDPNGRDPTSIEREKLVDERIDIEQELATMAAEREQAARELERLRGPDAGDAEAPPLGAAPAAPMKVNPRYAKLSQDIEQIQRDIDERKIIKGMTDLHPEVVELSRRLAMATEELARTSPMIPDETGIGALANVGMTREQVLEAGIAKIVGAMTARRARLERIEEEMGELRKRQAIAVEHRGEYLKLRAEAEDRREAVRGWQSQIGPIRSILTVEDHDRGVHFRVVEDVRKITAPSWPAGTMVLLACGGIGAATGVLFVLMRELVDRSYRTVKTMTSTLGIPVIESIDEIVTRAVRRRRLFRSMVLMPAATAGLAGALFVAGSMAYYSLESPSKFEWLKKTPARAVQSMADRV